MKKIYFVRHGESEANVKKIVAGSETDAAITEKGRVQAEKAGQELLDKKIELIVSSPLTRTKETATIIARHT
jgi:broad specificity phosphatase PhoE